MYVEVTLVVATVAFILYRSLNKRWSVLKKWNIPHDNPSIFRFGNAKRVFSKNGFEYELDCKARYGNIWGWYMLTEPRIVVHDPEILRQIQVKKYSTFPNRLQKKSDVGSPSLQKGLLAAENNEWKRMRTTLSPAFSTSKLKLMSPIFDFCVKNTIKVFEKKIQNNGGIFDTEATFRSLSLDVICSATFSIDVNSQDTKPEPLLSKHAKAFFATDTLAVLTLVVTTAFPLLMKLLPADGKQEKHARYMKNLCHDLIRNRQQKDTNGEENARNDIMDLMIDSFISNPALAEKAAKGLTEGEIFSNAATLLLAGYDTTGVAMTYLAYNLAMHNDIQERLQEEIDQAFANQCDHDIDTVCNIKYLDMCVNENLRLYGPIARSLRTSQRDVTVNGLNIPKGAVVIIPISALSHDSEYWNDPMVFNPERMRNIDEIDPMVFQPFGNGPRNCIGLKFALVEMKLAFCALLRRYSFRATMETPLPPLPVSQLQTTAPAVRFNLKIERR